MPRGGSLNEPTIADVAVAAPALRLPPARPARRAEETTTTERSGRRKAGFLTFLLAMLLVVGLLVLIGTQAMPWLGPRRAQNTEPDTSNPVAERRPATPPPTAPAPASGPTDSQTTTPATPPAPTPAESKPSPMPPPESVKPAPQKSPDEEAPKEIAPRRAPRSAQAAPQPVTVISSPGGATAVLDGRQETACTTPCDLDATPGRHTVIVSLPGYGMERREIDVGNGPMEMTGIVLHAQDGTLMLTTTPPGAVISVNGKRLSQTTPAQLPLPPGTYNIQVEKDGKQSSRSVNISNGVISYLKITF